MTSQAYVDEFSDEELVEYSELATLEEGVDFMVVDIFQPTKTGEAMLKAERSFNDYKKNHTIWLHGYGRPKKS